MEEAGAQAAAYTDVGRGVRPHDGGGGRGGRSHARPHAGAAEHRLRLARQPARAVRTLLRLHRSVPTIIGLKHTKVCYQSL